MSWAVKFLEALVERLSFRVNSPRLVLSASNASLLTCNRRPELVEALAKGPHGFLPSLEGWAIDPHAFLTSLEEAALPFFFLRGGAFFFPLCFLVAGGALGCLDRLPHASFNSSP